MHLAIVVDADRLLTDGTELQRLAVALVGEGIRVSRVMPPWAEEPPLARLIPAMPFDFGSSLLFRAARLGALSSALEADRPDVFIGLGPRGFAAAADLADDLDAGLVAMAATSDELDAMPLRAHAARLDLVATSTAPLAVRASRIVGDRLVSVLPVGVAIPGRKDRTDPSPQSLAIAGSGRDEGGYRAIFRALADVMPALPELQVAIELPPGHLPGLWRLARETGVHRVLNGVSRLEAIRPLALACGTWALPEPVHGTRALVLEAMALGRTVVALDDPLADHLIDGVSALVAGERDAREWAGLLARALLPAAGASDVGPEAAARTAARFASAKCAEQLADACASIVRGPSIPFRTADAT